MRWELTSSSKQPVIGQGETAWSCARGGSGCILRKNSSLEEWFSIGTGWSGRWWSRHPWKWHFMIGFNGHGDIQSKVRFDDFAGLFQPSCWKKTFIILWFSAPHWLIKRLQCRLSWTGTKYTPVFKELASCWRIGQERMSLGNGFEDHMLERL